MKAVEEVYEFMLNTNDEQIDNLHTNYRNGWKSLYETLMKNDINTEIEKINLHDLTSIRKLSIHLDFIKGAIHQLDTMQSALTTVGINKEYKVRFQ